MNLCLFFLENFVVEFCARKERVFDETNTWQFPETHFIFWPKFACNCFVCITGSAACFCTLHLTSWENGELQCICHIDWSDRFPCLFVAVDLRKCCDQKVSEKRKGGKSIFWGFMTKTKGLLIFQHETKRSGNASGNDCC